MHRFILNAPKGQYVDHRDRNGLNNQKRNLRFCTQSQNMMNLKSSTGTSKYKGVSWNIKYKRWQSHIRLNYKLKNLGSYNSEIEAALAYDHAARELFGEFARLNFPGNGNGVNTYALKDSNGKIIKAGLVP